MSKEVIMKVPSFSADYPKAPIYVADLVRCKECKWAKANGTYQWCGRLDSTARITADDFCSYGTRSKMEQVDKDINVRSKDEPQTMYYPQVDGITPSVIIKTEPQTERSEYHRSRKVCTLELFDDDGVYIEPQIQLTARCLNCNNAKACKEKHWEGCVYEPKDEKTCETCRHWKYIAHEWQCEASKCQGYEPKTEPQTCEECEHWSDTEDGCADRHGCTMTERSE